MTGFLKKTTPSMTVLAVLGLALALLMPLQTFAEKGTRAGDASSQQAPKRVIGTVVDATGEPLIGVSVTIVGKQGGAITDIDGKYSVEVSSGDQLKFSYIGYKDQVVSVGNRTTIDIEMNDDAETLSELVVVGYGSIKKESLTGAVTVVDSKAFQEKGVSSSPLQALQGQVPGVMITRSSTAPGDESWGMNLRGSVSANSTDPLIIVDGVAYGSANDLRLLNSNDIESINFLKDGAASIYGSRAAGGVVLITTKKAKEGRVKVEYSGSVTTKIVGLAPEMMNLEQWADGLLQAYDNDNRTYSPFVAYAQFAKEFGGYWFENNFDTNFLGFTDVQDFVFDDTSNWYNSLFGTAASTEHNLSVSGGTDKATYRLSLGYLYDDSNLKYGNNSNSRYNFRLNNTFMLFKNFTLDSSISYNRQDQVSPERISSALTSSLIQPGLPLASLNGNPYLWGSGESNSSPLGKLINGGDNRLRVSAISISETLNYDITDYLSAHGNIGYNTSTATRHESYNSIDYYDFLGTTYGNSFPTAENNYYRQTSSTTDYYSLTAYLNGHKAFGKHDLSLTLGVQYEFDEYETWGIRATGVQEGFEVIKAGTGDITVDGANGNNSQKYQYGLLSYFGRFNYDFDSRYLLELQARYDGSSKFLAENRWAFFWGASVGWRIKQEKFMKNVNWLSDLKLRLSYAQVGNQSGIGYYDGVQTYNIKDSGPYLGSDKVTYVTTSGTLPSTTRTWERIHNYNVGLDFGFMNNKLTGSIDLFLKKNNNMLISIDYPGILGDKAPSSNSGKFRDWGFEGIFIYQDQIGEVGYHIGGTFSFARNKLVDYGGTSILTSGYTSRQEGYPINSIFGLRYGGKIQNEEQLEAYVNKYYNNNGIGMPANLRVGDNMYCDENGDGVLDYNDYIYLGSDTPEISYSFNFGVSYWGFDVSVIFQGVGNRIVYRGNTNNFAVPFRAQYQNSTTSSIGNTWSVDNPWAYYAPYSIDDDINAYNYQASSLTAQNGNYLRLKNLTVGYTFPQKLLAKTNVISSLRLYVTGADLWEVTKIKDGWDPEASRDVSGTGRYPFTRNVTFGLDIAF